MKVISIMQPWATLIALGEKKLETRSWRTKHRGELAIHSSKKIDKKICRIEPYKSVLEKHGYSEKNLPIEVILATCTLTDCFMVTEDLGKGATLDDSHFVSGNEYMFGDFSEGRYAWEIDDIKQIESIPAKGQLRLWESKVSISS